MNVRHEPLCGGLTCDFFRRPVTDEPLPSAQCVRQPKLLAPLSLLTKRIHLVRERVAIFTHRTIS